MIVTEASFERVCEKLRYEKVLVVDTETTGLSVWRTDKVFAIIVGTLDGREYYFNYNELESQCRLSVPPDIFREHQTVIMHNAKFDMAGLHRMGLTIPGTVYDTEVNARLIYNEYLSYTLEACLERIGQKKSDVVKEYCETHKLWTWETQPGKKKRTKHYHYERVPLDLMVDYAEKDVIGTRHLYLWQQQELSLNEEVKKVSQIESKFTKVLFEIEKTGVKIDPSYCRRAFEHEHSLYSSASEGFTRETGIRFSDSRTVLSKAFAAFSGLIPTTDKGNASFTDEVISQIDHPAARFVQDYRESYKKAHTYYQNFLYLVDMDDTVHCTFRQAGTRTARLSAADPNFQNLPKRESQDSEFRIRRALVPRPEHLFVDIDYKAMEFKLMLDYAAELELIAAIKNGLDPHQATADLVGISRDKAKTLNFGLLYGMGVDKLAAQLGVTREEAQRFKRQYFDALPRVRSFIRRATNAAEVRGYVKNWAGRQYAFPDPTFSYKAANTIIQGGCADILRVAMVNIEEYLRGKRSRILLQVHDSLLFEVHYDELDIVGPVKDLMERAYPQIHIGLDCDVKYSLTSWGELRDWGTDGKEARDAVQGARARVSQVSA